MKQFTSYSFTTNTEVNLPAVLMMCQLLIHNSMKENQARNMRQLTSYLLPANTKVNLHSALMMCELFVHSIIKK